MKFRVSLRIARGSHHAHRQPCFSVILAPLQKKRPQSGISTPDQSSESMRSCLLALLLVVNPTQSLLVGSGLSCAAARPRMSIRMEAEPEPLPFISDDTYKDEVIESSEQGQPVIVDFFADW